MLYNRAQANPRRRLGRPRSQIKMPVCPIRRFARLGYQWVVLELSQSGCLEPTELPPSVVLAENFDASTFEHTSANTQIYSTFNYYKTLRGRWEFANLFRLKSTGDHRDVQL
jgi:hypothetical protein